MYQYEDEDQIYITVNGVRYQAKKRQPDTAGICTKCIFRDPTYRLLLGSICYQIPCDPICRDDKEDVFFVEVTDVPIR